MKIRGRVWRRQGAELEGGATATSPWVTLVYQGPALDKLSSNGDSGAVSVVDGTKVCVLDGFYNKYI